MDENFMLEICSPVEDQATSFRRVCTQLFSRNEFVDCALCCSDGQVQAHRVILASASNYLHGMLSTTHWPTPCSYPMLFFKTFFVSDMKLAMEFVYTGTTKVSKGKLPTLMNIARELGCSSLSKAIEKAIHSCGVEIFRQRMQVQSQGLTTTNVMSPVNKSITSPTNSARITVHSEQICVSNQMKIGAVCSMSGDLSQMSDSHHTDSPENLREDLEDSFVSSEIKLEPTENVMLELDPVSLVTTTLESGSNELEHSNANQAMYGFATEKEGTKTISNECKSNGNGQIQEDVGNEMRNTEEQEEGESRVECVTNEDLDNPDDDDEEMPITVVDLKSLAETNSNAMNDLISMTNTENTDSLPSNCPWCFQIFTSLTLLQRHIKTHVGVYKPHACQYCPASFARSAHLKRHIRTHTGERPFSCTFCDRTFSRQDKLKTHLEKHLLEQHMQNNPTLSSTGAFTINQSSFSLPRPENAGASTTKNPSVTTSTTSGFTSHKPAVAVQNIPSFGQSSASSAYPYFVTNDTPDIWKSDRAKGPSLSSGQVTGSTTASISSTPLSTFLVYKNA